MQDEPSKDLSRAFGRKLRECRLNKGLSQEELADLAGVHRTYVGMVERGEKNVTLVTLSRFAKALGATPADMLKDC
jgi:transcriptional regulator with XRE-family HTH domain